MAFTFRRSGRLVRRLPKECRSLLLCACATILFLTACSRPGASNAVTIEHAISPEPVRTGPIVVTLRLADPAARAVTGARISLEADMSHAGMAPSLGEAKEIAPGRYQASLTLEMAGDWVILLHVTLPGGQELDTRLT